MPLFRRKPAGSILTRTPPPGTPEHAVWLAEVEQRLGIGTSVAVTATPTEVSADVGLFDDAVSTPDELDEAEDAVAVTSVPVTDPLALAADAWAALHTGLPLATCLLPQERKSEHHGWWEIIWYRDGEGHEAGSYFCLKCYPQLTSRAYGQPVIRHGARIGRSR